MIALNGFKIGPAGIEPPEGARNRRKASVNKKNLSRSQICHNYLIKWSVITTQLSSFGKDSSNTK